MRKFTKIAAIVSSFALAFGVVTAATQADDDYFEYKGGNMFEYDMKNPEAIMTDTEGKFTITYTDANDGWGDIGFGFSGGDAGDWAGAGFTNPAGESATIEFTVAEVLEELDLESGAGFTFGKIEGYNGCEVHSVVFTPSAAAPAAESSSAAEESSSAAEESSSAAAPESASQTGDATSVAVLAVLAVLALAGVVVTSKKRA